MEIRPSGLVIPASVADRPEPFAKCHLCQRQFTRHECRPGGPYERHVSKCSDDHEQQIQERLARERGFHEGGDTELEQWVRRHRREILEGRKTDAYGTKNWKR